MKPSNVILLSSSSEKAALKFWVDPALNWFEGHFPIQPILPGVAQIDWVMHYANQYLTANYHFESLVQVKFQAPLLPNSHVLMSLHWKLASTLLLFTLETICEEQRQPISQGKIRLCLR